MSRKNPPLAKISRPNLGSIVPRGRLTALLDRPAGAFWISGPGGSGKTTLAAAYLEERSLPSLWYNFDETDADIATFFYYTGLAARNAAPRFRKPLPLLTPEYLPGLPVFARRFFESLYARLKPPFVIVFDNYQDAPAPSPLDDLLQTGLSLAPAGIRVFVLSRKEPGPAFMRLRANDAMHVVGRDDLRFTLDESKQLIGLKKRMSAEAAAGLHAQTEGWAAGLVLLLGSSGAGKLPPGGQVQPEVFDYFAGELFDKLDADTRKFLLATAFLPTITPLSAERLSGRKHAADMLGGLSRGNFFTSRIAGPVTAYRYHPLFRSFLQARIGQMLDRDDMVRLQKETARLLADNGQTEDAAALLVSAEDWQGLAALIPHAARQLIMQGRNRILQSWLDKLPDGIVSENPWLLYWSGVCCVAFDPARGRPVLERALGLFEARQDEAACLLAWSGIVQSYLIEFHDFRPLDRWIDWLESRTRPGFSFPSPDIEAGVVAGMSGILGWRRHNLPDREKWLQRTLSLPDSPGLLDFRMRAYTNCALFHLWMGDFAQCGFLIREMHAMIRTHAVSPLRQIILKITEVMLYNSRAGEEDLAVRAVTDGLRIARETGVFVMSPSLYLQGAAAALNRGDAQSAGDLLQKMAAMVGENRRVNLSHYFFLCAWRELYTGEAARAVESARRSLQLIEAAGVPASETLIRVVLAHGLQETGCRAEAEAQLAAIQALAAQTGSVYLSYLADLTEASFAFDRNDVPAGLAALRTAMSTGRRKDFVTMLYFWRPDVLGRLCGEAIEEGIEADYARRLITGLGLAPGRDCRPGEAWAWRLKIFTLGRFGVIRGDQPVGTSGKAQKKPLQMLKTVIVSGPAGISKEQLIDALWPDADGDAGAIAFHTTLSRLRKLIDDESLQFNDGMLTLDRRFCWVDAWSFEELLDEKEPGRTGCFGSRPLVDRAVDLYKGAFLPADLDFLPAISMRERLRSRFLRLIMRTGRQFQDSGNFDTALEYYARGLETDPLAEELHQGAISCHLSLGRNAEALRSYERCKILLRSGLGVEPSSQTEFLIRQVLGK